MHCLIKLLGFFCLCSSFLWGQSLELEANDLLRFRPTEFSVNTGEKVTLLFRNTGKIASLKHQFILLKPNVDIDQFGNELMGLGKDEPLPAKLKEQTIVVSQRLGPGTQTLVTFSIREPGNYVFICGFPGHHSVSKGRVTAK